MKKPKTYLDVLMGGFCQYITGDPKKSPIYCCENKLKGIAYCLEHDKLCNPSKYKDKSKNE